MDSLYIPTDSADLYIKYRKFVPKHIRKYIEKLVFRINQSYDCYISIGNNCSAAHHLKEMRLRDFSGPFDWLYGNTLLENMIFIYNRFNNYFCESDFCICEARKPHIDVLNTRTKTRFIHDFESMSDSEFKEIKDKYKRRQDRLYHLASKLGVQNVFSLYIEGNKDHFEYLNNPYIIAEYIERVREKLHLNRITLLILNQSTSTSREIHFSKTQTHTLAIQPISKDILGNAYKSTKAQLALKNFVRHGIMACSKIDNLPTKIFIDESRP